MAPNVAHTYRPKCGQRPCHPRLAKYVISLLQPEPSQTSAVLCPSNRDDGGRTEFNSYTKLPGQGPLVLAGEFWRRAVLVDGWIVEADEDVVRCGVWRGLGGGGSLELSVVLLGPRSIPCLLFEHILITVIDLAI